MRVLRIVLVMSANPPSLLRSCLGSRLERALASLVISVSPFRPLVLKHVRAVVES